MIRQVDDSPDGRKRKLNDQLRRDSIGGETVFVGRLATEDRSFQVKVFLALQRFEAFSATDDPTGLHLAGRLDVEGKVVCFRIEYGDHEAAGTSRKLQIYFLGDDYAGRQA